MSLESLALLFIPKCLKTNGVITNFFNPRQEYTKSEEYENRDIKLAIPGCRSFKVY